MCQRTVCSLGSFNCRTLLPVWRRHELAAYTVESNADILAIQEHCIHFEDEDPVRRFELGKGWLLLAASAYHCLSDAFVATPRRHMLLVCGDFNATLAPGDAGSNIAHDKD